MLTTAVESRTKSRNTYPVPTRSFKRAVLSPFELILAGVGLNPTTPQNDAGIRMDPATSVATAKGTHSIATKAASPPEDPPVQERLTKMNQVRSYYSMGTFPNIKFRL
jgi:hypothetical protein